MFFAILNFTQFSFGGDGSRVALEAPFKATGCKSIHHRDIPRQLFTLFQGILVTPSKRLPSVRHSFQSKSRDPIVCFLIELRVRSDHHSCCEEDRVNPPVQLFITVARMRNTDVGSVMYTNRKSKLLIIKSKA